MDNYSKVLISSLVLNITQGMLFPFLPIYAYEISGKFAYAGYIFSLPSVIMVAMHFGWGSVSDRLGTRKSVIVASNVVASILYFVFPFVGISGLLFFRSVQTFFYSSYILIPAMITEYFPSSKGRALGQYNVATGIGWTIGGVLSGHAASMGFDVFFGIVGVLSLLFCVVFSFVEDLPREKDKKGFKQFLVFGESRKILILCLYAVILMTGGAIPSSIFNVYLSNGGVSREIIGYVSSLTSLTFLLVAGAVGKACDRIGRRPLLLAAPVLYIVMWMGIGLVENVVLKIVLWILPFYALFIIASTSAVSDLTSEKERGRGVGILNSSIGLGNFLGGLVGGNLADAIGAENAFMAASICAVMSLLVSSRIEETSPDGNPVAEDRGIL
ncbi:MAG: MFS transporter [Theionarchaea archaeon]|nr:MFS transporter [Theionarchaea archaeon]MBU7022403.1 MFS transporter [Theionarchaea archaeon]MBU7035848.1 MFS transporter [Theionarchaea archaeon]MBU7041833.1 MFS transporter [Theionarchaea archaeon]